MNKKYKLLSTAALCAAFSSPSLAGWEVQWIDKFDGDGVDWDNWTAQTEANYNNEVQCYTDDDSSDDRNYEVSDGTLKIISRKEDNYCDTLGENKTWTSGRLNSKDKQEFLYGRVESRIKFHNLEGGTWPAFWMLEGRINQQPVANDDDIVSWPYPGAGEIDVWEWFSNNPDEYITNFFNESSCGSEVRYTYPNGGADVQDWHVYAMEWTADQIDFYIDNELVASQDVSSCSQYEEPMFVLLNLAMGGDLGGTIDGDLTSATLEVDYVAHCQESASSTATYCNEDTVVSDDVSTDDTVEVEDAYIAYSGEDDTFAMTYWADVWGTGSKITDSSDSPYIKSYEITPGSEWGSSWAVIAWGNDSANSVDISDYSVARFKVKTGNYSSVTVSVQNGNDADKSEITYDFDNGTDLGNGWVEISASLPNFTGMTWFGLMFEGDSTAEVADVYFTTSTSSDDSVTDDSDSSSESSDSTSSSSDPKPGGSVGHFLLLLLGGLAVWRRK